MKQSYIAMTQGVKESEEVRAVNVDSFLKKICELS